MPQSLSKVYTHIIFSTKHRKNLIDDLIENDLYNYVGGICKELECNPVQVGGHKNHIHLLCLLSRKVAQMALVQQIKQGSSKWIKTMGKPYSNFYWQDGYGIFSVSPKHVDTVIEYIKNQHEHHQKITFKDEYRKFLKNYGVDFDERYVWD
ncbi:IS200/IS605 family transposase [Rhodohalobacter sp.]|uniref:IS200/IS605 family transposase n=1 Tax=Rhodohalobacter sp. TaxID=1974210 RepID=UPI002ACD8DC0|nr:IS200/IS605 family transposase [Rhodohalobacter sp.]MDZ7757974.1 IS200/IS605 family transposase [Rhodohalobacter sp.]